MDAGTSFRQFEYCSLCKSNHKKRKKHVYSKHHQEILRNILKKFTSKISAAKKMLFAPMAREADFEYGAKFWCYFCVEAHEKHKVMEMTAILMAGLLEHIAGASHRENTTQFFWDNLITDKKLKANFLLSDGDLEIFRKASFLAVKKFQKTKESERKKVAATISFSEFQRQNFIQPESTKSQIVATDVRSVAENIRQTEERLMGKKTVSAFADGLSCVVIQGDDSEGNIFTSATPPWLLKDEPTYTRDCIGPTMEDYEKHLERERKSKLPATRVGAKFDHTAESSKDWLPSFGRVWSKGRRLQSKLHFEKEMKSLSKVKSFTENKKKDSSESAAQGGLVDIVTRDNSKYIPRNNGLKTHNNISLNKDFQPTGPFGDELHEETSKNSLVSKETVHGSVPKLNKNIMPYKRKRNIEASEVTESHWSDSAWSDSAALTNQSNSYFSGATNQIIPYKRKRTETVTATSLIQTPLLYNEKFNSVE